MPWTTRLDNADGLPRLGRKTRRRTALRTTHISRARHGVKLERVRVAWDEKGWTHALRQLGGERADWPRAENAFAAAARNVLQNPRCCRKAVIEAIRPKLVELMASEI